MRWFNWIGLMMLIVGAAISEAVFFAASVEFESLWYISIAYVVVVAIPSLAQFSARETGNRTRLTEPDAPLTGSKTKSVNKVIHFAKKVGPHIARPLRSSPSSPNHPFLNVQATSYWALVSETDHGPYGKYVDAFSR
ncbi:MAG: hypothetical protein MRJ68_10350 [Nitrospira sp.]|nr:hypothetical protein [Nitrospira sp.]